MWGEDWDQEGHLMGEGGEACRGNWPGRNDTSHKLNSMPFPIHGLGKESWQAHPIGTDWHLLPRKTGIHLGT